jgi:hypothetical protein
MLRFLAPSSLHLVVCHEVRARGFSFASLDDQDRVAEIFRDRRNQSSARGTTTAFVSH